MFTLLGALRSLPYVVATVALLVVYNTFVENPSIRREARQGYVQEASIIALQASNAELQRQARASEQLAQAWQRAMERYQIQAEENLRTAQEKEAQYVADPNNTNRCTITDSDLDFLR